MTIRSSLRAVRLGHCVAAVCASIVMLSALHVAVAGAATTVVVTPSGPFHDAQTVSVSVGANSLFAPHARVNVLECADPGGKATNLPKDITSCDGNTIQGATVLVGSNGAFSVASYPLYALPSATLGEQSNYQPVCNTTDPCVLYVGQDQNDFTAPKLFSAPFTITPSSSAAGGTSSSTSTAGANATSGGAGSGSAGAPSTPVASATAASALGGTLPNTGPPSLLPWLAGLGVVLAACGAVGRRRVAARVLS